MKNLLIFCAGAFLAAIPPGSRWTHAAFVVNVFEDGTLNYSINGGPPVTVEAVLLKDPTPREDNRLVPTFLVADQRMRVVAGDLILDEPTGGTSDVLRFLNPNAPAGPSELLFYSDFEPAEGASKFDVGLPLTTLSNFFHVTEQGPESGPNGSSYTPTAGKPGFFLSVPNAITYNVVSDAVPEPSVVEILALVGLAHLFVTLARRRLQNRGLARPA